LKDEDVLVGRFLDVENFDDLESHSLTGPLRGNLTKPAIYRCFNIFFSRKEGLENL
jgi:hypothetical protein